MKFVRDEPPVTSVHLIIRRMRERLSVAIQIPEDLKALDAFAATYPLAPTTVFIEPGRHPGVESGGASSCRLEIEEENTYVQFLTFQTGRPTLWLVR